MAVGRATHPIAMRASTPNPPRGLSEELSCRCAAPRPMKMVGATVRSWRPCGRPRPLRGWCPRARRRSLDRMRRAPRPGPPPTESPQSNLLSSLPGRVPAAGTLVSEQPEDPRRAPEIRPPTGRRFRASRPQRGGFAEELLEEVEGGGLGRGVTEPDPPQSGTQDYALLEVVAEE